MLLATFVLSSLAAAPLASASPGGEVSWLQPDLDGALRRARAAERPVLVYFWMDGSEECTRMYGETMQDERVVAALDGFVAISARAADERGYALFERFGIRTVPALRVLDAEGAPQDAVDGYAPADRLIEELARIAEGRDTLADLSGRVEAAPDDMELRWRLAGKLLDLGSVERHDEVVESIRRDDPTGGSEVAARLIAQEAVREAMQASETLADVDAAALAALAATLEHELGRFVLWAAITNLENGRGRRDAELAALREAWAVAPADRRVAWGVAMAEWLWTLREELPKEDRALALELARECAELAARCADGDHEACDHEGSDGSGAQVAQATQTLAKCLHMNGKKREAGEALARALELARPEEEALRAEIAARAAAWDERAPDACFAPYDDSWPAWSPDGKELVFVSTRDGYAELYVRRLRDGRERRLTRTRELENAPCWSPDGRTIAYEASRNAPLAICALDVKSGAERVLLRSPADAPHDLQHPTFSPDGERLALATFAHGKSEIAVALADGSGLRILTADTPETDMAPRWSADGERVLFMTNRAGDADVWSVAPEGGEEVNVTNAPVDSWDMDPDESPDGRRIAFASWRSGSCEVWVMDADGSNARALTQSPETQDRRPRWSPDGERIAFERLGTDGQWRIFVMDADGANAIALAAR